jgi:hypothetical protein
MLGIARAEHLGEAREELEVVLAAVEHNRLSLQQQLARRRER